MKQQEQKSNAIITPSRLFVMPSQTELFPSYWPGSSGISKDDDLREMFCSSYRERGRKPRVAQTGDEWLFRLVARWERNRELLVLTGPPPLFRSMRQKEILPCKKNTPN